MNMRQKKNEIQSSRENRLGERAGEGNNRQTENKRKKADGGCLVMF